MVLNVNKVLPPHGIKELCELSSRWNIVFIALEYLSIFLAVYLAEAFFGPISYVLAVIWIGSRLHALAIFMHEAAHYRLFRNRRLNEMAGEILLAWPITLTLKGYRNSHLMHHQYLNTPEDPDWGDGPRKDYQFPKTRKQMLYSLVRNAIGFGFYEEFTDVVQAKEHNCIPLHLRISQCAFFAAIALCSLVFSFWKLLVLYWAVPAVTSFIFFAYVRAIAEHYALDYSHELTNSRTTLATFAERILLAPYHVGFHLDHHLFPAVPWYKLPALHRELMKDPQYSQYAHITKGYFGGVLEECVRET